MNERVKIELVGGPQCGVVYMCAVGVHRLVCPGLAGGVRVNYMYEITGKVSARGYRIAEYTGVSVVRERSAADGGA